MFTDYRNKEHSKHYCQLSPSQILEIVKTKCFGTEIFKHGIYAQSVAFSPMMGLIQNHGRPNVDICTPSGYSAMVYSREIILKGEQIFTHNFLNIDNQMMMYNRMYLFKKKVWEKHYSGPYQECKMHFAPGFKDP